MSDCTEPNMTPKSWGQTPHAPHFSNKWSEQAGERVCFSQTLNPQPPWVNLSLWELLTMIKEDKISQH